MGGNLVHHAFYRGGPVLTSAISGIDMALWDIKGKALGVPVYELLGGPTRSRIRVYGHASDPDRIKELKAQGFRAFKSGVHNSTRSAIAPHNPLGPISLAAGLQLAAAIPNFLCQEQVNLGEGYLKTPFLVRDGFIDTPTAPGLGIEIDEDQLALRSGHDWQNPKTYYVDGSVVDW